MQTSGFVEILVNAVVALDSSYLHGILKSQCPVGKKKEKKSSVMSIIQQFGLEGIFKIT